MDGISENKELGLIDAINTYGIQNTHPFQSNHIEVAHAMLLPNVFKSSIPNMFSLTM
jgi:hypothetical protein